MAANEVSAVADEKDSAMRVVRCFPRISVC
jgi:hypothetical protein